jgi:hypothetical protein
MTSNHHSKFLECLENVWYLNTYSLASSFTIADRLIVANTGQGNLQTGHEIRRRKRRGRLVECYVSFRVLGFANTPEPLHLIREVISSLEILFFIIHDSCHVESWWK